VFDLADLQGYSPSEIGKMLEMNAVTVRANLCKARRAIRTSILDQYPQLLEERLT
jgi:DNA-directed RNA polymerase specialized sigma24 family protein